MTMKQEDFIQKIRDSVVLIYDNPDLWINKNKEPLLAIANKHGANATSEALSICINAGKLDFFFHDFPKWLAHRNARKKETEQEYYQRTGLSGSLDKKMSIAEERARITPNEREKTAKFLCELKNNLRQRRIKQNEKEMEVE